MTLILSAHGNTTPIHFVSDTLISSKALSSEIGLPHEPTRKIRKFGSYSIVGLAQKTIIFGNTIFQWSGRHLTALRALNAFFRESREGMNYVPVGEVIKSLDLLPHESEEISVLVHFCDRPENVVQGAHWISRYDVSDKSKKLGTFFTSGTGSWDFIENFRSYTLSVDLDNLIVPTLHRLAMRTVEPFFQDERSLNSLYGGWFELSRHRDRSFEKQPIAFKFWPKLSSETRFSPHRGPLIFSNYIENDLFIFSLRHDHDHTFSQDIFQVACPLGRGRTLAAWSRQQFADAISFRPTIFFHVLYDIGPSTISNVRILPFYLNGDPLIDLRYEVSPDGRLQPWLDYRDELTEFINSDFGPAEFQVDAPD